MTYEDLHTPRGYGYYLLKVIPKGKTIEKYNLCSVCGCKYECRDTNGKELGDKVHNLRTSR